MNETLNVLKTRRSVRKYKKDMVPEEILDQILEAGTYAPTGMGKQNPVIICITDKEIRDELAAKNAEIGGWPEGFDPFYGAPVVCLVAVKHGNTDIYDGSAVITNMLNAAHSLGIGSCWIHRAKEEIESDYGKELLANLGLEGDYVGVGHVILGYADGEEPQPKPRKDDYIIKVR